MTDLVIYDPAPAALVPQQADNDGHLVALWLYGRSAATQRAYGADVRDFLAHLGGRTLRSVTVGDVQSYGASLVHLSSATQARRLSSVKSLLAYGHRLGYLPFDVGAVVATAPVKNTLAERILAEPDVQRLLALETSPRNAVLLRLLYAAGLRISEVCGLRWRDARPRDDAGQITIWGKGGKTRAVLLPATVWAALVALRQGAGEDDPIFQSQKRGHLDPSAVHRIVKAAATRAGLSAEVSAHWLRHAHASHALDRGAPVHLVQATLGHASVATTGRYAHARPTESSSRYLAV